MSFRIYPPKGFTKTAIGAEPDQDAFELAAAWLDSLQAEGFVPATQLLAVGTTGHVTLIGPRKSNLVFRSETTVAPTAPSPPAPTAKRKGTK